MENKEVSHTGAWIGAVLAAIYLFSPIDFVPDVVPIAGWLDDALIAVTGGLNLIQSYLQENNALLAGIVKFLKWGLLLLGILIIGILALTGALIYSAVK